MAIVFENYPTLNEKIIKMCGINRSFELYYTKSNEKVKLICSLDEKGKEYYLDNSNNEWNPNKNDLHIQGILTLDNFNCLFGKIADDNSILGIGVNVYSKKAKTFKTYDLGYIIKHEEINSIQIPYDIKIEENSIVLKICLEFFLYVKESVDNNLFAKEEGSNLGILDVIEINVEGNGSIFPIKIIEDNDKPLWTISFNYIDITDTFDADALCLCINKNHKDYHLFDGGAINDKNILLWKEILSSFFIFIILNEKESFANIMNDALDNSSIGAFLKHNIRMFEISENDLERIDVLADKIKNTIDKRLEV